MVVEASASRRLPCMNHLPADRLTPSMIRADVDPPTDTQAMIRLLVTIAAGSTRTTEVRDRPGLLFPNASTPASVVVSRSSAPSKSRYWCPPGPPVVTRVGRVAEVGT